MSGELHCHTRFCDGRDAPEALAEAAAERGFDVLGFSGHAYTSFDPSYCMSREGTKRYCEEILRLREVFRGRVELRLGVEQDLYADDPPEGFDYVIGSVHYLETPAGFLPLDESPEGLRAVVERGFGGDPYRMAEAYFHAVASVPAQTGADVVGHLDLLTKYRRSDPLFDESHPRYRAAAEEAVRAVVAAGCVVEVNTGAMARGLRATPYPAAPLLRLLCALGGRALVTGDCHDRRTLGFGHEAARELLRDCGFDRVLEPVPGGGLTETSL